MHPDARSSVFSMPTFLTFKRLSPLGAAVLILIMVLMLYPVLPPEPQQAHAATTRYASPSGSGTSCTSTSPCSLQTAINQAVAGDTVTAPDGIYGNNYNINSNSGTSGSPILLKSTNLHGAVLDGQTGGCDASNGHPTAFDVFRSYWIIEGFDIRNMCFGINIDDPASNVEVRHNFISPFNRWGMAVNAPNSNVHHNVIAFGFGSNCCSDWAGLAVGPSAGGSIVRANWIYSVGNRRFIEPCCGQNGYVIAFGEEASNVTLQGNVLMDGTKGGPRIFGNTSSPSPAGGTCVDHPDPRCGQAHDNGGVP
jgi:hypothetical protein